MTRPVALTIAGADPSGGAGLQADLKTFAAHGVYGLSVASVLTAQNATHFDLMPVPGDFIRAQAAALFGEHDIRAIKIGMLAGSDGVAAAVDILQRHNADRRIPVVVDPILAASVGGCVLDDDALSRLRTHLLPRATLVKPNLMEAARLTGTPPAESVAGLQAQAEAIRALGAGAVLVSGGHLPGDDAVDVLASGGGTRRLTAARSPVGDVHGTGCTLTAAIAANLARGLDLTAAVVDAKNYLIGLYRLPPQRDASGRPVSFDHLVWCLANTDQLRG